MDTFINSKAYWEQRFLTDWESSGGRKQSAFFAHIAIDNLPHWFVHDVCSRSLSICDWGCALGDGTNVVASHFSNSTVTGIDISAAAISEARKLYSSACFRNIDLLAENRRFDVLFTSNTLEHFADPWNLLSQLSERSRNYVCVLVPFYDTQMIAEHVYDFRYDNLRVAIGGVFSLVFLKVIESSHLPDSMWHGQQVLMIYAHQSILPTIAQFGAEVIGPAYQEAFVLPSLSLATERLAQANINAQDLTLKFAFFSQQMEECAAEHKRRIRELEEEKARLVETAGQLERSTAEARATLDAERAEWKRQIRTIKSSLSWRVTRPLRAIPFNKMAYKRDDRDSPEPTPLGSCGAQSTEHRTAELDALLSRYPEHQIIVFRPHIDWDLPLFQRPQHIARELARRGFLYFFCTPHAGRDKVSGYLELEPRLVLTDRYSDLLAHPANKIMHLYSTSTTLGAGEIGQFMDLGLPIIYEYVDEISEHISSVKLPSSIHYRHRAALADDRILCIATADKLLEDVRKYRTCNYVMAGNGVDYQHFANPGAATQNVELPQEIVDLIGSGRPVIGYFGAFARWFDYETVRTVALSRPDYAWLLIGHDYDGSIRQSGLDEIENVHVTGPIRYELLPAYARHFSVSTIPFLINDVTLSTSPIKLFEYMALGRPIVTTSLPECRKYRSATIADSGHDFAEKIDFALGLRSDEAYLSILRKEGLANTWAAKADLIAEAISDNL